MKRIMSILTAVFMSVGLLSVNVRAEGNPKISISGSLWIYDETASGEGWNFSRNGTEGTLELTKTDITGEIGIYATDMNLTIILTGANKVTGTAAAGINVSGNLTITGDGSLNVSGASGYGIKCKGTLTFSGNITVTAISPSYAMKADGGFSIGEGLGIVSPEGARISDDGTTIVNKDDDNVIEATIGPETVTITFDANGASSVPEPQTIVKGGKATEPSLYVYDNDLYYLEGWYDNADFLGDPVDFRYKTFDSDTTLYASWERPVEVQVGIWGEGYSSAPIEYITVNGVKFPNKVAALVYDGLPTQRGCPISVDAVISEGYGFVEVVKDSDGTHLSDELPYTNKNNDTSWDEPAIAIWLLFGPLKTVTFVDEDGTVLQESEVPAGKTPEYTGDTPTRKEDKNYTYTFAGWSPEITTVTDDATYTATYTKKKKSSDSNNSSNNTNNTAPYTPVQPAPETDTYTAPVTPAPVYRPVTPAVTYYTVTFDTDGGTEIAAQSVQAGDTAYRPADPAKDGYTFAGWYTDKEYSTEFIFSEPVNKAMTVYAKWEEEKAAEPEPVITDEPEPAEPDEPAEPVTPEKKGNGLLYGGIAAVLALLGVIFGVMRRKG